MNPEMNDLVEEITREVLSLISRDKPGEKPHWGARESAPKSGFVLVMIPSPPNPEGIAAMEALARKAEKFVVAADDAEAEKLMHQSTFIFIPSLSFQDRYALLNKSAGTFPLALVSKALEKGLAVYALREGIEGGNELLKILENIGLNFLNARDIAGMSSCALPPCSALTGECNACGHCPTKVEDKVDRVVLSGACRVGGTLGMPAVRADLAPYIDHTLLKPEATREDVLKLCLEAKTHQFASVCINPSWVSLAAEELRGSGVKVCTVVGFPLGATTTITKVMETRDAIANGADEIDMVINVGALKAKQDDLVLRDIEEVREAADGKILKVILETALLSDEEKIRACGMSKKAGADFVKTSTGFGPGGATAADVALMRRTVGEEMGVKASGGIRDTATALKMVEAGATRIGASASVAIVKGN